MDDVSLAGTATPSALFEMKEAADVIETDLGKFGKAKMHRPSGMEFAALVAVLVFAAVVWLTR